jgi:hypothetical protein
MGVQALTEAVRTDKVALIEAIGVQALLETMGVQALTEAVRTGPRGSHGRSALIEAIGVQALLETMGVQALIEAIGVQAKTADPRGGEFDIKLGMIRR